MSNEGFTVEQARAELDRLKSEVALAIASRRPVCPTCSGEEPRTAKDGIGRCIDGFHAGGHP